jgi:hypothetical protein
MIDALLSFLISLEMNDNDRRALLVLVIILLILLLIIGLIGMGIRWIIMRQADKADNLMYDVTVSHVINNPRDYRKMASKKNFRLFFQKSLIPLGVIALGVLIWVIYSAIVDGWNRNIFEEFLDLFFLWHYEDPDNYVQIFGMTFLAKWPAPFEDHPVFHVEHLASYIVVPIVVPTACSSRIVVVLTVIVPAGNEMQVAGVHVQGVMAADPPLIMPVRVDPPVTGDRIDPITIVVIKNSSSHALRLLLFNKQCKGIIRVFKFID